MVQLTEFGAGQGYLKAGLLGFAKSGKTFTASHLAIYLQRRLGFKGHIALFDTEAGGEYIAPIIRKETGLAPIGLKSRSLADLMDVTNQCVSGLASVLIADSITHVWREVCAAYLAQVNKARETMGKPKRTRLEFQDWAAIKDKWNVWTDLYLNSPLHIIICGRAGFEWDFEEHEDSLGNVKKELVKTGIKMKVENEFGFEPSLLVEMERVQVPDNGKFKLVHRATVLGDRFASMDGAVCDNPTGEFFKPHIDLLIPGAQNIVDTTVKTDLAIDETGDAEFQRTRKEKTKYLEEIEGEMVKAYPGQSGEEKKLKMLCLEKCFKTKSWTAITGKDIPALSAGLEFVREFVAKNPKPEKEKKE